MRIVSLVPSTTHTICYLGRRDWIVGCTQFCVDPPGLHHHATLIGGTKDPDLVTIAALKPDIIFTNQEENRAPDIEVCRKIAHTIVDFPCSPADVPIMLKNMGSLLSVEKQANQLAQTISTAWRTLTQSEYEKKRFIYLIWRQPWMGVGKDTYISRFLEACGWENALTTTERYPVLDFKKLKDAEELVEVDQVFFSSEPYPFRKRDIGFLKVDWPDMPDAWWIDGKLLSWHGAMTEEGLNAMLSLKKGEPQKFMRRLDLLVDAAD